MSSSSSTPSPRAPPAPPPLRSETFQWSGWEVTVEKGHIITKEQEESLSSRLTLPHLPDMLFACNSLTLRRSSTGAEIRLTPLDALRHVNDSKDLVHVAMAGEWAAARKDSPHIRRIVKPFDWTYTPTDYRGTLIDGGKDGAGSWSVSPSEQGIDYERLKVREKILFFDELILYEDELDDNGCTVLTAKIRVMPSCLFCLLRFYLRVDNTLLRVIDTRIYHEFGASHFVREYTEREERMDKVSVPPAVWKDPNEIVSHLPLKKEVVERLEFDSKTAATATS